ncbi:MAG: MATE family efflux transporter [Candidatus Thermoplasmatota archaeon]|nr:MATE family efflux transporter [Candidatus Thermoplasmatota archaeon]
MAELSSMKEDSMSEPTTKGVDTLLGNPRKAILKLSIPMIIAMAVQTAYNLADAVWVSGLGSDSMSAVGFFFPFFFLIMALAAGIGIGGGAAISRRIGARDKEGADNVADHVLVLMLLIAVIFTVPTYVLLPGIFRSMGAGEVADLATGYGRIIIAFSLIIFFSNNAGAILRAEGDTKRAMYAMVLGSVLNIFLDPLFIYGFGLGVAGAAWATMISFSCTAVLLFYWLFLRKNTYVTIRLRQFRFKLDIFKDVMKVGFPATLQQGSMAFNMMFLNIIVVSVGGTDGVAVFSTGWRVVMIAVLPLMGIASALIPVAGAAYGARSYRKVKVALYHAIRYGLIFEIFISVLVFIFAGYIVFIFTWSPESQHLRPDLVIFLRMFSLMSFSAAFGMLSGAVFQAIGKGFNSLLVTIFRTIIFSLAFAWLFGIVLDWGLMGVWIGILTGNAIGAIIAYIWIVIHVRGLESGKIVTIEHQDKASSRIE